jgi:hypothetical protein
MLQRDLLLHRVATGAGVDQVNPKTLQLSKEGFALLNTPLFPFSILTQFRTLCPVRCTYPNKQGLVCPSFTHALDDTQWESHTVRKVTAVRVSALVGNGGKELVYEVSMGSVNLDEVDCLLPKSA